MSQFTSLRTIMVHKLHMNAGIRAFLRRKFPELNFTIIEEKTEMTIRGRIFHCDFYIEIEGNKVFGFSQNSDSTYSLIANNIVKPLGMSRTNLINKITQQYAKSIVKSFLRKKGFRIKSENTITNTIRIKSKDTITNTIRIAMRR